jgi:hypothetical protein
MERSIFIASIACVSRGPFIPGIGAGIGAHLVMDTTLNYAIGVVVLAGAIALALAILVW